MRVLKGLTQQSELERCVSVCALNGKGVEESPHVATFKGLTTWSFGATCMWDLC